MTTIDANKMIPFSPVTKPASSDGRHGRTSLAPGAGASCRQDETAGANSAAQHANRQPIANASENGRERNSVTFATSERNSSTWYDKGGRERSCDWCGRTYVAKRSTSKFCGSTCRWHAHQQRHNGEVAK